MDLLQFMTILLKAFTLEANATGMNTEKSKFFFILEKQRGSQNSKKLIVDDKKITN